MTPTRVTTLAAVAGIASVLGFALANVVETLWQRSLPVPWSSVITVAACGVALAGWAVNFRRRIRFDPIPVDPVTAVRTAALSMAASRAGSIIAGLYAGIGLWFAADLSTPVARDRALTCAVGVVVSLALVGVALWLERICRLPEPDNDATDEPPPDDSSADWVHPREASSRAGSPDVAAPEPRLDGPPGGRIGTTHPSPQLPRGRFRTLRATTSLRSGTDPDAAEVGRAAQRTLTLHQSNARRHQ